MLLALVHIFSTNEVLHPSRSSGSVVLNCSVWERRPALIEAGAAFGLRTDEAPETPTGSYSYPSEHDFSLAIDHRARKARALVRSPRYKPCADDLVVWWVTTCESSPLIVLFCFC